MKILNQREKEIMTILWQHSPLTKAQLSEKITFPPNTIFRVLNSLMNKGYVDASNSVIEKNIKSRLYTATLTQEEYNLIVAKSNMKLTNRSIGLLLSSLIDDADDESLIEELEEIIRKKKES